jgi:hypothetical protein
VSCAVVLAVVAAIALACSTGGTRTYAVSSTIVDRSCGGYLVSPVFAGSGPPGDLHGNDDPRWRSVRWRGSPPATERSGTWERRSGTLTIRDTSPASATFTSDRGEALEMTMAPGPDLC